MPFSFLRRRFAGSLPPMRTFVIAFSFSLPPPSNFPPPCLGTLMAKIRSSPPSCRKRNAIDSYLFFFSASRLLQRFCFLPCAREGGILFDFPRLPFGGASPAPPPFFFLGERRDPLFLLLFNSESHLPSFSAKRSEEALVRSFSTPLEGTFPAPRRHGPFFPPLKKARWDSFFSWLNLQTKGGFPLSLVLMTSFSSASASDSVLPSPKG